MNEKKITPNALPLIVPAPPSMSGPLDTYLAFDANLSSFEDVLRASSLLAIEDSPTDRIRRVVDRLEYPLPDAVREKFTQAIGRHQTKVLRESFSDPRDKRVIEIIEDTEPATDPKSTRFEVVFFMEVDLDDEAWEAQLRTALDPLIPGDLDKAAVFNSVWRGLAHVGSPGPSLRRGLLMAVVAAFDTFLSLSAKTAIEQRPQILRNVNRQFSSRDVLDAQNLDDLRSAIVNDKLSRLAREGFPGYQKFFASLLGDKGNLQTVHEIVERRNVFVHHGGRVSNQYLQCLAANQGKLVEGDELDVSAAYLRRAIAEFRGLAWSLSQGLEALSPNIVL
ncbi:hypothetical protein [Nocardioides luteus]|uniref:hypothetical protein n=1 Tax=Nocardioides luteus TaxID=1844 RepID=UPI000A7B2BC2|nr:hypothetical protein [Nocardioides luteus]